MGWCGAKSITSYVNASGSTIDFYYEITSRNNGSISIKYDIRIYAGQQSSNRYAVTCSQLGISNSTIKGGANKGWSSWAKGYYYLSNDNASNSTGGAGTQGTLKTATLSCSNSSTSLTVSIQVADTGWSASWNNFQQDSPGTIEFTISGISVYRTACSPPTGLSIKDNGNNTFSISATKGSSGTLNNAQGVVIQYSTDNSNWTTGSSGSVSKNTTIYARAYTDGEYIDSGWCSTVNKTILYYSACDPPTGLTIKDNGNNTFSISATKGASGSNNTANGVVIQYSTDNKTWTTGTSGSVSKNTTIYARAYTTGTYSNSGYCSTVNKTILYYSACGVPTGLTITDNGNNTFTISATKGASGSNNTATGVVIQYSTDNKTWKNGSSGSVSKNTTIYARAYTTGTYSNSGYCSTVNKTIKYYSVPYAPSGLTIKDNGNNTFTISGKAGNNGSNTTVNQVCIYLRKNSTDPVSTYDYRYYITLTAGANFSKSLSLSDIGVTSGSSVSVSIAVWTGSNNTSYQWSPVATLLSQTVLRYTVGGAAVVNNIIDNKNNTFTIKGTNGSNGTNNTVNKVMICINFSNTDPSNTSNDYNITLNCNASSAFEHTLNNTDIGFTSGATKPIRVKVYSMGSKYSNMDSAIKTGTIYRYTSVTMNNLIYPISNESIIRNNVNTLPLLIRWNTGSEGTNNKINKYEVKVYFKSKTATTYNLINTLDTTSTQLTVGLANDGDYYFIVRAIGENTNYNSNTKQSSVITLITQLNPCFNLVINNQIKKGKMSVRNISGQFKRVVKVSKRVKGTNIWKSNTEWI